MIIAEHEDGRIVLMASEYNLKPMLLLGGKWGKALISGYELDEFSEISAPKLIKKILASGLKFARNNPEFLIDKTKETNKK